MPLDVKWKARKSNVSHFTAAITHRGALLASQNLASSELLIKIEKNRSRELHQTCIQDAWHEETTESAKIKRQGPIAQLPALCNLSKKIFCRWITRP